MATIPEIACLLQSPEGQLMALDWEVVSHRGRCILTSLAHQKAAVSSRLLAQLQASSRSIAGQGETPANYT